MNVEDIYTSLDDAKAEIERRWKDEELKKKVEEFWKDEKPNFISIDKPSVVLSKSLISPNLELKYFFDIVQDTEFNISLWEYKQGKFVGKNQEKRYLGKMYFHHGLGKHNGNKIDHKTIVNFNTEEGKKIFDVVTTDGVKLSEFHHTLLKKVFPNQSKSIIDISDWFDKTKNLDEYYVYYLSLFIRNNILFENFFFDSGEEGKFTIDKFMPSFNKVTEIFGVKPLIVPLLPQEHEKNPLWLSYNIDIEN